MLKFGRKKKAGCQFSHPFFQLMTCGVWCLQFKNKTCNNYTGRCGGWDLTTKFAENDEVFAFSISQSSAMGFAMIIPRKFVIRYNRCWDGCFTNLGSSFYMGNNSDNRNLYMPFDFTPCTSIWFYHEGDQICLAGKGNMARESKLNRR